MYQDLHFVQEIPLLLRVGIMRCTLDNIHHVCVHLFIFISSFSSVPYRTLKLFFIGCGKRGKTTLLRRLRERQAGDTERTEGIDIEEWSCKGAKRRLFRAPQEPIQFLAWDFAGQEVYQVTHQCFYSRRAIYLALFRLSDGEEGIDELEPWLRNVQVKMRFNKDYECIVSQLQAHSLVK